MPKVYETLYGWSRDDRLMHETRILEIKPPSTCIRIFLNPQLFLCGSGFLPHVSGESSSRRIRNFLNPLSKEEISEYVIIPESCGRSVWTVTRHHLLTGRGRGEEWPDGLGGVDVRHFRLVGAKSEYFFYTVTFRPVLYREYSRRCPAQHYRFFTSCTSVSSLITCVQLNLQSGTVVACVAGVWRGREREF